MTGTLVNVAAIIVGSLLGCFLRKGVPERLRASLTQAMGLAVILIGVQGAVKTESAFLIVLSMVLGTLLGTLIGIEKRLNRLGDRLQSRFASGDAGFAKGFVSASLIFCVGAMAIVGSMDSGLRGDHATLFAKSVLDGVTAMILASTLGVGVMLSAVPVLLYQGAIALSAGLISPLLTERMILEMSAAGGLLIVGIGVNMLRKEHIPVGDMLPAMFLPLALLPIL